MLRFFSSIRQKLLNENKTVKYLKYAVGEIVLIMLGIFLAMQLNNWNEARLEKSEGRELLSRIAEDIRDDVSGMKYKLPLGQRKREALNRVAITLKEGSVENSYDFLVDVGRSSHMGWSTVAMSTKTFEESQNAGKFGLIQNELLRKEIKEYFEFIETSERQLNERIGQFSEIAYNIIPFSDGGLKNVTVGLTDDEYDSIAQQLFNSEMSLHINRELNRTNLLLRNLTRIEEEGAELLVIIESELNN